MEAALRRPLAPSRVLFLVCLLWWHHVSQHKRQQHSTKTRITTPSLSHALARLPACPPARSDHCLTMAPQTRIALSILVSCLIYNHPVTELGLLGMLIVFGAVFYRISRRIQGKKLLVWEGMEDSKGMDMFHEWHEHLDL